MGSKHLWAVVLAAGEGTRLQELTSQADGPPVPKQFCTLYGGPTLLGEAVARASSVVDPTRVCAIVADQHAAWWQSQLQMLAPENIIVQPENRGTAIGILYSVQHILARDPDAHIILLPADHYVGDESVLQEALNKAARCLALEEACPVLLGFQAEWADTELGYIVPGEAGAGGSSKIDRFVEKPSRWAANDLVRRGGLWNTFIMAISGRKLLETFFAERFSAIVARMQLLTTVQATNGRASPAVSRGLARMYSDLPTVDFSRDILAGRESQLRALEVPACGWSDLGTPERVVATLERLEIDVSRPDFLHPRRHGSAVNLASQVARRHGQTRGNRVG